jgi:demethylphylloquinone reductase
MGNNQQPTKTKPIDICIIGGGFGGLYTALYFSRFSGVRSGKYRVTLIEPNDRFLFSPLLYELITGELERWEIAPSYQKLLAGTRVAFRQQRAIDVDFSNRYVTVDEGDRLTYDYLVFAVGRQNYWADIPGAQTYALPFRTLADAERLMARLELLEASNRERLRLAVIGGGASGVELACKLADRLGKRGEVCLLDRGGEILKNMPVGARKAALRALNSRRVRLEYFIEVKAINADELTLVRDGNVFVEPIDLVLWTAGTQVRDWIDRLPYQKTDGAKLPIRPSLQSVDFPEVLILGDMAEIRNGSKAPPATAQVAYQQASCAAKNLKAMARGRRLRSFRYLHLGDMLTLGKGAAVVSSFFLNLEGKVAAIARRFIYIQRLPTLRHRLQVLRHLLTKNFGF